MSKPYKVSCPICKKERYSEKNANSACCYCKERKAKKKKIKDRATIQFKKQVYLRDKFTCQLSGEYLGDRPKKMYCFKINKRKLTPKLENYITVSPSWASKLARLKQKELISVVSKLHR